MALLYTSKKKSLCCKSLKHQHWTENTKLKKSTTKFCKCRFFLNFIFKKLIPALKIRLFSNLLHQDFFLVKKSLDYLLDTGLF